MCALESVQTYGFALVPEVFPGQRIDGMLEEIARLSPVRTRAGFRHALRLDPVLKIANDPTLLNMARRILGPDAYPYRATLFDKSPASNWLVIWHQDIALPVRERANVPGWGPWSTKDGIAYTHAPADALSEVLALRVHLDDSTTHNGPLKVLPRTHNLGILCDDRLQELARQIPAVECVSPKGGVVAMRPLIVHASSKSQNERPRRVLHIEYAASEFIASPFRLALG